MSEVVPLLDEINHNLHRFGIVSGVRDVAFYQMVEKLIRTVRHSNPYVLRVDLRVAIVIAVQVK